LQACATTSREDVQRAALASQQGKHLQWNPLEILMAGVMTKGAK
jgi:hypothetical protein